MWDGASPSKSFVDQTMVRVHFLSLSVLVTVAGGCYLFPSDVPDPCDGVVCGPGELCHPTPDGRSYNCECPTSCPSYGDHEGSRPLCASDARDYPGECEMRRAACETNTNITFKYYGKCDPCAGVTCPDPEVCQLDDRRSPSCRCAEPCPLEFSPVCASDGKTYSNECQMHRESCRARKQLKIIFKGQCTSGVNPCAEVECRHGAECRVEGGGAVCACPPLCEPVLRPVCGSDSRTHDNECELRRAACVLGRELKLLHSGACGSNGVCAGRVCPHGGECVVSGARGACRCPHCSNEFAPVCGSDGISYGNRCKLQLEACRHRRDVTVLYDGPCNGCENKKCEFYAVCESDGVSEASCVCPKHCEEGTETEEVCGNDNLTYSSVCALRDVACREKKHLHVKHMGSCGCDCACASSGYTRPGYALVFCRMSEATLSCTESCTGVVCPSGTWCARGACSCSAPCGGAAREPVCANTGHTYVHECALRKAACEARMRADPPVRVAYYGECTETRDDNTTAGLNKTTKATHLSNEIRSEETDESSSEPGGIATAVCARVQCAYEATCAVDASGQPRCACLFDCAAATALASAPVCASDLRLYPTLCHMKLEACRRQEDLRLRPLALCKGLEFRPCGDDEPLTDADGRPLDCGGGPHRKDCPIGSYCHHTAKAARCCRKDKSVSSEKSGGCEVSWHGCCADGVTPARGVDGAGCPAQCGCHRLGAAGERCDEAGQCVCRPGVGGLKCDRCEPAYWGLPRIGTGHTGCIPCGCSAFGSVREDCEQMTGRCVCKPGIQGQKCTVCSNHEHVLTPTGCVDPDTVQLPVTSCDHVTCYFGAYCVFRSGIATCECPNIDCPNIEAPSVCGSDGRTYISACHLRTHACRTQADVVVQAFGPCSENGPNVRRGSRSVDTPYYPRTLISRETSKNRDGISPATDVQTLDNIISGPDVLNTEISLDSDSGKPDSPVQELTCVDILPPIEKLVSDDVYAVSEANVQVEDDDICSVKPPVHKADLYKSEEELITNDLSYDYSYEDQYLEERANEILELPLFDGQARLTARTRLPAKRFDIWAEVSSVCGEGTLLSAGGIRDHLWLGFVKDKAVLRWDAGSGPLELQAGTVNTYGESEITARRYKKDAVLRMGRSIERGTAPGRMTSLNVEPLLHIGHTPDNITKVTGATGIHGFVGCVHRLRVSGRDVIPPSRGLPITAHGLRACTPHNLAQIVCP